MYNIALVGSGNLATCLVQGLLQDNDFVQGVHVFDIDKKQSMRMQQLSSQVQVCDTIEQLQSKAHAIVFCVKPQQMCEATKSIPLLSEAQLLISVAAGIDIQTLCAWTGSRQWVRSMPNLPMTVNLGMTALYASPGVSAEQRDLAAKIFSAVGKIAWLEQEQDMGLITALSGSGPAYFFYVMNILHGIAKKFGLEDALARQVVAQTALGAVTLAQTSEEDWSVLCQRVASKGGTTESALNVFKEKGMERIFDEAIQAAADRCQQISEEFNAHKE